MFDIARNSAEVGQEARPTENNGIVANKACEQKEERIEVDEQSTAVLSAELEDLESQPADQARCIDGDRDICQCEEEYHDVDGIDVLRPDSSILPRTSVGLERGISQDSSTVSGRATCHGALALSASREGDCLHELPVVQ